MTTIAAWVIMACLLLLPMVAGDAADPASLYGMVRYNDGSPVAGADLAVLVEYACTDTQCALADVKRINIVADVDGRWSVSVPPGGLTVVAWAEGDESVQESLTVRPGESREVDLVVQRLESSVSVRVASLDAVDRTPVNAEVYVNFRGEQGLYPVYETATVPGTIRVAVYASPYEDHPCGPLPQDSQHPPMAIEACQQRVNERTYHAWARLFTAEDGAALEVEARLVPMADVGKVRGMQGAVVGWVIGADGQGVPDAVVSAYNEASLGWGHARTDQHGAYRMKVTAGHIVLHAAAADSRIALWSVDVPARGVAHANLVLAPDARTCCWEQPATYMIPADGPAPDPPAWMPIPVEPRESSILHHGADMERQEKTGCFDWCQSFQAVKPNLGPYDPSIDLSSTSDNAYASLTALPAGLAVVAVAAAGGRKRR